MDPETRPETDDRVLISDHARAERAEATLWQTLSTLYRWRRFIAGVTLLMAAASVVISLLLPNEYRATTRLLLPDSGSGGLSAALLGDLSSVAKGFLGGQVGDYTRYLALLTSRTTYETLVDSFDLVTVYKVEDKKFPREEAIKRLEDNLEFVVDKEYEFLSVNVLDRDPERAAAMANFLARFLNHTQARLSSETAGNLRRYVEQRYAEAQSAVDSLLDATRVFQQRYGVFDLSAQTQGFFTYLAELRANTLQAEIQYEALRERLGEENEQVKTYRDLSRSAARKYADAVGGREALLPVPQNTVPEVVRQYADLERERIIQTRILEIVAPLLEQARFEELRKVEAVQVVDMAFPPALKAAPKRSIIVVMATLSAFLLTVLFVLVYTWWEREGTRILSRLRRP
jgi:uncharacterized protein involved in exopolysaccharide biosynthesis